MRGKKARIMAACMIGTMLLGGCGTAPYTLTEEEEGIIVNYAAHVVSKFNAYQGDGLTYVREEEPKKEAETQPEDSEAVENTEEESTASSDGQTGNTENAGTTTLDKVFGTEGLKVSYAGHEIKDSYVESEAFAVNASAGKTYLILKVNIANESDEEIHLDNLSELPAFKASFIDGSGKNVKAPGYTTILLNDFSTYDEKIAPETEKEAVLLFEVSDSVTSAEQIVLQVKIKGTTHEINL